MLDVLQIGASRAGSTWLWRMLQKHPQAVFPVWGPNAAPKGGPAYSRKSGWFWNNTSSFWKDNHWGQIKPRAIMNLDEYRTWYDSTEEGKVKFDVTEGAAWIPESRIKLIKETYPNVKIAYCVRNPITTIWSHMRFSGRTTNVNRFLQGRGGNYERNVQYIKNIKRWEKYFPSNVHVYFFNQIGDNPIELLEGLSDYFGIDRTIWRSLPEKEITTKINSSKKHQMPAEVKTVLVNKYQDRIKQMEIYFNEDLSRWVDGEE